MKQPNLEMSRIILRPLNINDVSRIHTLINRPEIAEMTSQIPHPYPLGLALSWLSSQQDNWNRQTGVVFGIELKDESVLIGVVSLQKLNEDFPVLGYWLGTDFWGRGYTTEAAMCICGFAFNILNVKGIFAGCLKKKRIFCQCSEKIRFQIHW